MFASDWATGFSDIGLVLGTGRLVWVVAVRGWLS